jgi:UDPglucose 6-dehydrogenase
MRDAPSIDIIQGLLERGATVRAFDPQAMQVAKPLLPDIALCADAYDVCAGADALVIITEWNLFRMLDLERVKALLRSPAIVDLRNVYKPEPVRAAGFRYVGVGRG